MGSATRAQTAPARVATPTTGTRDKLTEVDFVAAAASFGPGIEAALVHAIADAESGGKAGFGANGLPIIAYEGQWFQSLTKRIYDQSHPHLSYRYEGKAGPKWQKTTPIRAAPGPR